MCWKTIQVKKVRFTHIVNKFLKNNYVSVEDSDLPPLKLDSIEMEDVYNALKRTKPAQNDNQKYIEWHQKFGSA